MGRFASFVVIFVTVVFQCSVLASVLCSLNDLQLQKTKS